MQGSCSLQVCQGEHLIMSSSVCGGGYGKGTAQECYSPSGVLVIVSVDLVFPQQERVAGGMPGKSMVKGLHKEFTACRHAGVCNGMPQGSGRELEQYGMIL